MDWNAKLVRFFLHNTRLVWLLIIGLAVGGFFSIANLRREGFPQVSPRVVVVQTVYPGASPQEVENQVTEVIESGIKDVKGLKESSSTSANSFSNVVITLDASVDLDQGIQDVQTKVQAIRNQLPVDVEAPKVRTFSTGGSAFIFGVTDGGDLETIRGEAQQVADEMKDVPGVKSARLLEPQEDRVVISFRPAELTAQNVSLETLTQILRGANVNLPIAVLDIDDQSQSVMSVGAFTSLDDLRQTVVGANPRTGQPVRVEDVATVTTQPKASDTIERFGLYRDGRLISVPGVMVAVDVTSDADIIRTRDQIFEHLDEKKASGELPLDIEVTALSDQAEDTAHQVEEIVSGALGSQANLWLLGGFQLLFLSMLLFVNWRAAVVASLALPFSLAFTFISLALFGVQLNTIVLFSLILVLGLIVDPAIVMVEAMQRYRDLKYSPDEAALESGRRYGASLFMAVLTSLIVFFPFGVVSGIFGEIIKYIPLTVIPALLASYLVPIGLLPMISRHVLASHRSAQPQDGKSHEVEGLSRAAEWVMMVNRKVLAKKRRQVFALVAAVVLVAASLSLVGLGKVKVVQFSTPEDNVLLMINATLEKNLTFEQRDEAARSLEQLLAAEPSFRQFMYYSQSRDGLLLFATLAERGDRVGEQQGSKDIVQRLRQQTTTFPRFADVVINELSIGPPESDFQIQTQLFDNDPVKLEKAAKEVGAFLAGLEHVIKVDDGFTNRTETELRLTLDRAKVQQLGLVSFNVGQQLKSVLDETAVTRYYSPDGETLDVVLTADTIATTADEIGNLPISGPSGKTLRVRDVASIDRVNTIDSIQRFDGQRYVNVRARVDDSKNVIAVQQTFNEYLTDAKLTELGLDNRASRGEFDEIAKSFKELGIALVVAVLLTYIVLVLQFKSFSQPAIMLVTVPLSLIGVFPALWLTGSDLGFLELLGVTILVGIVENVAIFLIDYANQLVKEQGMSPRDAIIQASGVRFRPIILTKLVALASLLPLAVESEFWRGLSVVIIAGIGLSGFFSLVIVPMLYVWIAGLRGRVHRRIARS